MRIVNEQMARERVFKQRAFVFDPNAEAAQRVRSALHPFPLRKKTFRVYKLRQVSWRRVNEGMLEVRISHVYHIEISTATCRTVAHDVFHRFALVIVWLLWLLSYTA